eukprot:COSAG06_NODE_4236_length_4443_cov_2.395718_3_plen_179_part_00
MKTCGAAGGVNGADASTALPGARTAEKVCCVAPTGAHGEPRENFTSEASVLPESEQHKITSVSSLCLSCCGPESVRLVRFRSADFQSKQQKNNTKNNERHLCRIILTCTVLQARRVHIRREIEEPHRRALLRGHERRRNRLNSRRLCRWPRRACRKRHSFSQLLLCSSRACLGKLIVF